jgi:hypothetical protein
VGYCLRLLNCLFSGGHASRVASHPAAGGRVPPVGEKLSEVGIG